MEVKPYGLAARRQEVDDAGLVATSTDPSVGVDLKSEVLGGLTLKVSTIEGRVYATFLADQPGVKDLVDLNAQQLEKALRDKGLGIGEIKTEMRHGLLPDEQQRGGGQDGGGYPEGSTAEGATTEVVEPPRRKPPEPPQKSTDYTV